MPLVEEAIIKGVFPSLSFGFNLAPFSIKIWAHSGLSLGKQLSTFLPSLPPNSPHTASCKGHLWLISGVSIVLIDGCEHNNLTTSIFPFQQALLKALLPKADNELMSIFGYDIIYLIISSEHELQAQ